MSNKTYHQGAQAAATEWTFEQNDIVAGRRGAVMEDDFYKR